MTDLFPLLLIATVALPLAAAVITALIGPFSQRLHPLLASVPVVAGTILSCLCSLMLLTEVMQGQAALDASESAAAGESFERAVTIWTWAAVPQDAEPLTAGAAGPVSNFVVDITLRADALTAMMLAMVTFVASLVAIYSMGYMQGDRGFWRFFAYVGLFVFSMTMLVAASNFLLLFVFWEGVGLCSYLLISFWFDKTQKHKKYGTVGWKNSIAGRKAFIVNRIGDFGLLLGIFLTFWTFGTLDFYKPGELPMAAAQGIEETAHVEGEAAAAEPAHTEGETEAASGTALDAPLSATMGVFNQAETFLEEGREVQFGPFSLPIETVITLITLLFLLGVTGKSAQIPLFVWLPDAMAGPTPVSALIHAATMVTAGVYLIVRSNVFFHAAPFSSAVVTLVGSLTALVGGFIALGQWDIKGVLAYSTVSQLGYMVAAAGLGAYAVAIFHLVTHAFFKALLFLGSGVVIHAMEHGEHHVHEMHAAEHGEHDHEAGEDEEAFDPQDMRNMGGLRHTMPRTYLAYLAGTLALAGIFPFAGFWSKDDILAESLNAGFVEGKLVGYIAFALMFLAALLTALYMGRQIYLVFIGRPRSEAAKYTGERAYGYPVMVRVLQALAIGTLLIGLINIPSGFWIFDPVLPTHIFTNFLEHTVVYAHPGEAQMLLSFLAVAGGLAMFLLARFIYLKQPVVERDKDPLEVDTQTAGVFVYANAKMYWDETYFRFFEGPFNRAALWLANRLDWAFLHDFVHETVLRDTYNGVTRVLTQPVDLGLIDGTVNGVGRVVRWIASRLRRVQTGYVRVGALSVMLGALLILILMLAPMLGQLLGM
jgi:NADH-quinone oxidoreductase subunit L